MVNGDEAASRRILVAVFGQRCDRGQHTAAEHRHHRLPIDLEADFVVAHCDSLEDRSQQSLLIRRLRPSRKFAGGFQCRNDVAG